MSYCHKSDVLFFNTIKNKIIKVSRIKLIHTFIMVSYKLYSISSHAFLICAFLVRNKRMVEEVHVFHKYSSTVYSIKYILAYY